jgi:hypothetical protein
MDQLAGIVAAVAAIGLLMCALRLRGLERKLSQLEERLRRGAGRWQQPAPQS